MATIISHWLKVHSRWLKNYIFVKRDILISELPILLLLFLQTYYCAIFNSLGATIRASNSLNADQAGHLSDLIWVQTVCRGYQHMTKVATSGQRVR